MFSDRLLTLRGFMGLLFIASIVFGVVLYAPFMRRLDFGTLRTDRSRQINRLDWHNLVGISTVAWVSVVALTGIINTLETPIIDAWKYRELADLVAPFEGRPISAQRASLDLAVSHAVEAAPEMELQFVAFPGTSFSTPFHYAVFLHGRTPVSEPIITPALVNAETGEFAGLRKMPWWVKTLSLSRPFHFGGYGGLWLKVIWAVLDLLAVYLLINGLMLWLGKYRRANTRATPLYSLKNP